MKSNLQRENKHQENLANEVGNEWIMKVDEVQAFVHQPLAMENSIFICFKLQMLDVLVLS